MRLTSRVSRVLKRKNRRTEVTSTNLAHTAPYCLPTSFKTMAERYHKNVSFNSTLVPPPFSYFIRFQASELFPCDCLTILPSLNCRKSEEEAFNCPRMGWATGCNQRASLPNIQAYAAEVRYLLLYLTHPLG